MPPLSHQGEPLLQGRMQLKYAFVYAVVGVYPSAALLAEFARGFTL
jgi:hypothetical protein